MFRFLREIGTELFASAFPEELAGRYRQTGAAKPPVPPALLAMAPVLQAETGVGDPAAVELTLDSKRWQWVLDGLGAEEPLFSQGIGHKLSFFRPCQTFQLEWPAAVR